MTTVDTRSRWLAQLKSTTRAERARAEAAASLMAVAAGFQPPQHFLWFDSPLAASWAVAVLIADGYPWSQTFSSLSREARARFDETRATIASQLGVDDPRQIVATSGQPRLQSLVFPPDPRRLFASAVLTTRFALKGDAPRMVTVHDDDLERAEGHFWRGAHAVLASQLHAPSTASILAQSYLNEYGFSMMADDEARIGSREAPGVIAAAFETARSAGLWWPFEHLVIFSDRPEEIQLNEGQLLHNGDGPAVTYRDGWRVFAWNGKAVPERWIMDPASVTAREVRGFDPTFRAHLEFRGGARASTATAQRRKPAAPQKGALAADHATRLEQLRARAGGRLPFFDRYIAGQRDIVWKELIAFGAEVREEPVASDALAVAYETMHRVDTNVRTVVQRLRAVGYQFGDRDTDGRTGLGGWLRAFTGVSVHAAHVPPNAGTANALTRFEKVRGALPLSLRVFHEVVGSVNLNGRHPDIMPRGSAVAADPLVVYPLDEDAVMHDEDDEGEPGSLVVVAPDDLHKAGSSGGDPYGMAIPDLRADGELLNERHRLMFVDYLRLSFAFGGFPGYEGQSDRPAVLDRLSEGLVPF